MALPDLLLDPTSPARALGGVTAFYVSGEDAIESRVFNTAVGVTLTIGVRVLLLTGAVQRFNFLHTPNTAGTVDVQRFALPEGWILSASVSASAGAPTGATCVAVLRLVAGVTANAIPLGVLAQGAVTASQELSWPLTLGSGGAGAASTPGTLRAIVGTDPAGGVEIDEVVPTGKLWNLIAFRVRLNTSATVANRIPSLNVFASGQTYWSGSAVTALAASSPGNYTWSAVGAPEGSDGTKVLCLLPPRFLLGAGHELFTDTANLQVGDNYDAPHYLVEEWSV